MLYKNNTTTDTRHPKDSKMAYISGGEMLQSKSPWRLSVVPELLWGIINFFVLFFQTMINPSTSRKGDGHTTDYRAPGRDPGPGGPGGGPRRRMGGFRGGAGAPSAPPMAGGG